MRTRAVLTVAGWLAGATTAVVGVTAAMSILGHDLLGGSERTLTAAQVQQQLAQTGSHASGVAAPATAPTATATWPTAQRFTGGIVSADCENGQAKVLSWTVDQGFHVASVQAGPAAVASIHYASGATTESVTVTCVRNAPRFATSTAPATTTASGSGTASTPAATGATTGATDPDGGGGGHGGRGPGSGSGGGSGSPAETGGSEGSGGGR